MDKNITINNIPSNFLDFQDYSVQDDSLIANYVVETSFNPEVDYIEYYVYDQNKEIIFSQDYGFRGYSIIDGKVTLDPVLDLESKGYDEGTYNTVYNFVTPELNSSPFSKLYIDQVSSDRTEIRLNTTQIPNPELIAGANSLLSKVQSNPGVYFDFYLDFGDNQLIICNNILLDTSSPDDPTVLIKLYEPLPLEFDVKDECWVVTKVSDSIAYNVGINPIYDFQEDILQLKGPNLNLSVKDQINNSTDYQTYTSLTTSSYASGVGNLQYQVNSILNERGVEINIDYSNYENFIYLSSALTRLENFYYKLQLIEEYTYSASLSDAIAESTYVNNSQNIWLGKINEIITTFDSYDYYLYYESSSTAWPKTNNTYPYSNVTTTSAAGLTFIQNQSLVAAEYDENNNNALINAIPQYLRDDSGNAEYELFTEMLAEMFDNIWVYYQDVTNKWSADNRLQYGISKDLVADVLRDLGIKIYQSSFGSADLYTALLGVTPGGDQFPFPYMTGSLPTPSGYEYVNTLISASSQPVPLDDIEKETYKRLYHNLPMLLKKKGTTTGLQNLITTYGIPSTILRVAEFGGKDKDETNDWDYYKQKYNYKFDTQDNGWIQTDWTLNSDWGVQTPKTLAFRFKTPDLQSAITTPNQMLWSDNQNNYIYLNYTGSGYTSGSYQGSIPSEYKDWATLNFVTNGESASVYLPFFSSSWWSVAVSVEHSTDPAEFTLYAANSFYNGDDGSMIGFEASASIITSVASWLSSTDSYFPTVNRDPYAGNPLYIILPFSGSYQELRYYSVALSSSALADFAVNSDSTRANNINQAADTLAFRGSLGGELFTSSFSIHPKVSGSWATTASFAGGSGFTVTRGKYSPNTETEFLAAPAVGIKNIISNKIQIVDPGLPSGDTLSQYISIQQQPTSSNYTENLAYTEVAFSPQNEINDDIMNQLGFFNIGEFIGDPRQRFNQDTSYPDLDVLRNAYFEKYSSNYDLNDYIRLIKFFDNSLFKMIKDWTPARASLASGVVVKQHILERNKYPQPEVTQDRYEYSGSIDMVFVSGGVGGSVNKYNSLDTNPYYLSNNYGLTQSWVDNVVNNYGVAPVSHSSQDEFYNGEYSGSRLVVENGELNEANPFKNPTTTSLIYDVTVYDSRNVPANEFLTQFLIPTGDINIWFEEGAGPPNPDPIGIQYGPTYALINYTDKNGVSSENEITNMFQFTTLVPGGGSNTRTFRVISVDKRLNYAILTLVPDGGSVSNGTTGNNQVVTIEPYSVVNFTNTDYDVLINNAVVDRLSEWYQEVDYSTNQNTPINFAQLISGSAYPAAVQDSNYTSYQYSGIRYWGSKNTTDNINSSDITNTLLIESTQSVNLFPTTLGYPSVEKLTNIGLYYEWAGGTDPEVPQKTNFQIKFMFDADGNVFTPNISSSYYNDLLDAFSQNTKINVIPYNPNNGSPTGVQNSIQGVQTVFWPGCYFNAYLTSQVGSTSNNTFYTDVLRYQNIPQNNTQDLNLASTSWFNINLANYSQLTASSGVGNLMNNNFDYLTNPTRNSSVNRDNFINYQVESSNAQPNRDGFDFTNIPLAPSPFSFTSSSLNFSWKTTGSFSPWRDLVRVPVTSGSITTYQYFDILGCEANFGATNGIVLNLSGRLNTTSVQAGGEVNNLTLLRRVPAPEKLYVNVNKTAGESGPGFILPVNITSKLSTNFPAIVENLSNKNLL